MLRSRSFTTACFVALVAVYTVHALSGDLWDDALFFHRFGYNLVEHGVVAWNVEDGPVHGNTSQLFQLVAAATTAVAPGYYHVGIKLVLALAAVTTFAVLSSAVGRLQPETDEPGPRVVLWAGLAAPTSLLLVSSGMETPLALAVLAAALFVLGRPDDRSPGWVGSVVGSQVLVYLARPDMVLLSLPAVAVLAYQRGVPLHRQVRVFVLCGLAVLGLGLTLGALRLGYGTAFPLSFYLKSRLLTPYDAGYQQLGVEGERRQVLTWFAFTGPFVYLALFGRLRWILAFVVPALGFVLYHYLSTIGVMGYHSRFFQPATVPVVLAAALAWPRFATGRVWLRVFPVVVAWPVVVFVLHDARLVEGRAHDYTLRDELWVLSVATTGLLGVSALLRRRWPLLSLGVPVVAVVGALIALPLRSPPALDDHSSVDRIRARMKAMHGIELVEDCLPEPLHLYHSELGVPGVMFPESRITDLSGLMNPELVFSRPSFDDYCLADPPDVLFLPHRTHERLNREVRASRCIDQFVHPKGIKPSSSPMYIRRDRMEAFEACRRRR